MDDHGPTAATARRKRADAQRSIEAVLEAAQQCLRRDPDASASEIARVAGVNRVTLYAHFPSRTGLVDCAFARALEQTDRALADLGLDGNVNGSEGADDVLVRLIESSWPLVDTSRQLLAAARRVLPPERIRQLHDPLVGRVHRLIDRGRAQHKFRDDLPTAWLTEVFFSVVHGAADQVSDGQLDAKAAPKLITSTLLTCLGSARSLLPDSNSGPINANGADRHQPARDVVLVRPAQVEDLDFLVWVMRTAATSHLEHCVWDALLGLPSHQTDELLRKAARSQRPHWCHWSRFWVAEINGEPVGAASGYDTSTEGTEVLEEELVALAVTLELDDGALEAAVQRSKILDDVTPANRPGSWGVENVAVQPGHRGRGVVPALFERVLGQGQELGFTTAQILCLDGNARAERAWRGQDFTLAAERRDDRFATTFACPGMKLFQRPI